MTLFSILSECVSQQKNPSPNGAVTTDRHKMPKRYFAAPMSSGTGKVNAKISILSGGLAGGCEILVTYPTEFIKTQLQLDAKAAQRKYRGSMDVIRETMKTRGILGLYRGLSILLLGSVPKAASRFWAYEQARGFMMSPDGKLTRSATLVCGLVGGVTEAIVAVAPMETIKVKLIHDRNRPNPHYKGLFHGIRTIAAEEGLGGLYKGVTATILKQGSNQAIRFYVFGEYSKLVVGDQPGARLLWWQSMIGGVIAGAASVMGNNPFDVIKTNMQGLESHKYKGVADCARQIFRDGGFSAFYKGAIPRMGRVCGDVAIVMTMYDQIRQRLEKVPFLRD